MTDDVPAIQSDQSGGLTEMDPETQLALAGAPEAFREVATAPILKAIRRRFGSTRTLGFAGAVPMLCQGEKCPFVKERQGVDFCLCPLYPEGLHPLGKPCPIEVQQIMEMIRGYAEELGVNSQRMVHTHLLVKYVTLQIIQARIVAQMSQDPRALAYRVTEREDGGKTTEPVENPLFKALAYVEKMVKDVEAQLVNTPKEQDAERRKDQRLAAEILAKFESRGSGNPALNNTSRPIASAEARQAIVASTLGEVIDAECEVKDEDAKP